jgi:hypothetical protein
MPLPFLSEDLDSILGHCGDRATFGDHVTYGTLDREEQPVIDESGASVSILRTSFVYRSGTLPGIQIGSSIEILDSQTDEEVSYKVRDVWRKEAGRSQTLILAEV